MAKQNDQTGGNVDSKKVKLENLSEKGKYEVKELCLKRGEKEFRAIIRADFDLIKKAYSVMLGTKFSGSGKGESAVEIEMDLLGAGDKLLFMGWHEGDDAIREQAVLRIRASQTLGEWLTELIDDDADDGEKKS